MKKDNDPCFKYQDLKQYIIRRIRGQVYQPGKQIDSEQALANRLGFSRNTVRQALNELEQEGYLVRIQGKGTFLREDAPGISKKIALILHQLEHSVHPIIGQMIRGIQNVLEPNGFQLEIVAGKEAATPENMHSLHEHYCGLLIGSRIVSTEFLTELNFLQTPVLFVKNYPDGYEKQTLRIDFESAGFSAAEHLIQRGKKNLALIGSEDTVSIGKDFANGIRNACLEYGVRLKSENIYRCDYTDFEVARRAVREMLEHTEPPDGIVTACDEIAFCVMKELIGMGYRIPEQIAVIGCNDTDWAALTTPALTTLYIPFLELGEKAAEAMLTLLDGQTPKLPLLIPTLRIRESS